MNIAALLAKTARTLPERPAVSLGGAVTASYGDLHARAGAIAGALRAAHGLEPGARVAIVMANRPDYLEALFGIWYAGPRRGPRQRQAAPARGRLHPGQRGMPALHRRRGPCGRDRERARRGGGPGSAGGRRQRRIPRHARPRSRRPPPRPGPMMPPGSSTPAAPPAGQGCHHQPSQPADDDAELFSPISTGSRSGTACSTPRRSPTAPASTRCPSSPGAATT